MQRHADRGDFDERTLLLLDLIALTSCRWSGDRANVDDRAICNREAGGRSGRESPDDQSMGYSLKAVRFEGTNVLRSPQACQFIARQPAVWWRSSLRVAADALAQPDSEAPWFPLRLTVERDHISVMTGFGTHAPARSGICTAPYSSKSSRRLSMVRMT